MRAIKHILVVFDPTSDIQHCVNKGAGLARAFGAVLELFVCDYQSGLLFNRLVPEDIVEDALKGRRMQLIEQLEALAQPLRHTGLKVVTNCSFQDHLHAGVIAKVRTSGSDLVIKDTHFHGAIRRALFTISDWHLVRECPVPLLLTKPAAWHANLRVAAALDPGHADDKPASLDRQLLEVTESFAVAMGGEVLAVHAFDSLALFSSMTAVANGIGTLPSIDIELVDSLRKFHDAEFKAVVARHPAFEGRCALIEGSPAAALPAYAAEKEIDVLVTGAVFRSALHRLVVGSTAERLLDRLPCDILVVKPEQNAVEPQPAVDL